MQVFEYCIMINTADAVVERSSKYFSDLLWTVGCGLDYLISGHDEKMIKAAQQQKLIIRQL